MASIAKRPDGRWRARYRDAAGKEHARHFKLQRDAQRWLDETTATIVTGIYVDPNAGRITFERWFKLWCAMQVWTPGTLEAAERAAMGVPFAKVPLNKIRPSDVQAWVASMQKAKLATSTIRMRFNYVHMAFRAAVGERIAKDPSRLARNGEGAGVRLPKAARSSATMTIPRPKEVRAVYEAAPFYFRPFIAVCAFAGLRLGEAAGLQLGDIDFLGEGEHGISLHVQRQVQGQTRDQVQIVDPKALSDRHVPIPDALVKILSEHVRTLGTFGPKQWLFTPDAEHLYNRNSAAHRWREACAAAGVTGFTLHDLRHFYASGLIASGCDVVTVQRALGHSKPTTTLSVYAHLWPDGKDRTRSAAAGLAGQVLTPADSVRTKVRKLRSG